MSVNEKPTILIVDDEKNTREGLARALKRHNIVLADQGETALDALGQHEVDLVLSDVRCPAWMESH